MRLSDDEIWDRRLRDNCEIVECCICYQAFGSQSPAYKLKKCGHMFCKDCLIEWAKNTNTCPMCRALMFIRSNSPGSDYSESSAIDSLASALERLELSQNARDANNRPNGEIVDEESVRLMWTKTAELVRQSEAGRRNGRAAPIRQHRLREVVNSVYPINRSVRLQDELATIGRIMVQSHRGGGQFDDRHWVRVIRYSFHRWESSSHDRP